jgi:putative transposase
LPSSLEAKRGLVEPNDETISIRRQCELVGLSRASYYRQPAGETPFNLALMRLIDKQYTQTPFYGYRKITVLLAQQLQQEINKKRIARLMTLMGLQAVYPRPKTSTPRREHKKYPYLLRGLAITRPNQVWCADITYIPMHQGFMYLVAIMDWYSRFVLTWQLSNTLDGFFCLDALDLALQFSQPAIFNTDQGAQFTAYDFTSRLEAAHIRVSMDARGRAFDNIFIERLWRTVKYEDIYLKEYDSVPALETGLTSYFQLYNYQRPHQSLAYRVPADVYFGC